MFEEEQMKKSVQPVANSVPNLVEMSLNDQNDDVHMAEEIIEDEEIFDFGNERKNLFQNLLSSIMKSKVKHSLPNDGVDELLQALAEASKKSNQLFKRKFKEAISSQNRKMLKNCASAYIH